MGILEGVGGETRWNVVVLRILQIVLLHSGFVGSCSHFSTLPDGISQCQDGAGSWLCGWSWETGLGQCQGDIPALPGGSSGAWLVFQTFGLQDSKSEAS